MERPAPASATPLALARARVDGRAGRLARRRLPRRPRRRISRRRPPDLQPASRRPPTGSPSRATRSTGSRSTSRRWRSSWRSTGFGRGRGRRGPGSRRWRVALAAFWYAANPGPTFDGWHGLGWRTRRSTPPRPPAQRVALAVGGLALAALVVWRASGRRRGPGRSSGASAKERGVAGLLVVAAVADALARQVDVPGVEPVGYWPRWAFVWALVAFALGPVAAPAAEAGTAGGSAWSSLARRRRSAGSGWSSAGIGLTWYHRPLDRLRDGRAGQDLHQRDADGARPGGRPGAAPLQDDHQPLPRGHAVPQPPPARRAAVRREHGIRYHRQPRRRRRRRTRSST